jgi:amidase
MSGAEALPPISALGAAYRRGEMTPTGAAERLVARIEALEPRLRAFAHFDAGAVMAQARAAEQALRAGYDRGPLHGAFIGIKDLCFTTDMPTKAGMTVLPDGPAAKDATVVARLRAAGAIIVGKLQMTEGAMGMHHPSVKPPVNPWNEGLWTGVSSSGSGVAAAAGLCQAALGSDTGGSIRFPSSCNSVTGLKPTWGRVSRAGVFPLIESMDHVGPMARTVMDVALTQQAIAGFDPDDPTSLEDPVPDYAAGLGAGVAGLSIGLDEAFISEDVDPEVTAAVLAGARALVGLGAVLEPVHFPRSGGWGGLVAGAGRIEILMAHARTFPERAADYGPELRAALESAADIKTTDVVESVRQRQQFCRDVERVMQRARLLILPALPYPTPTVEKSAQLLRDPQVTGHIGRFTMPFDLTGHPTITLPCGFDSRGGPIGLQLVGRKLEEGLLLAAGRAFQQATDFHVRAPAL